MIAGPASDAQSQRHDLRALDVNARCTFLALAGDAEISKQRDHGLLEPEDQLARADPETAQIDERVEDQLPGAVVGHLSASVHRNDRDRAGQEHVLPAPRLPEGEHRIVLEPPDPHRGSLRRAPPSSPASPATRARKAGAPGPAPGRAAARPQGTARRSPARVQPTGPPQDRDHAACGERIRRLAPPRGARPGVRRPVVHRVARTHGRSARAPRSGRRAVRRARARRSGAPPSRAAAPGRPSADSRPRPHRPLLSTAGHARARLRAGRAPPPRNDESRTEAAHGSDRHAPSRSANRGRR